jgi:AraC-like DNA-binding protein
MKHGRTPYTSPVYKWKGISAVFYSSHLTSVHSHNTMQVVLDIQKKFKFRIKGSPWCCHESLIIKENVIHQLDTNGSVQLIIYLDPETEIAKAIKSEFLAGSDIYSPDLNIFHFISSNELQEAILLRHPDKVEELVNRTLLCLSRKIEISKKDKRILCVEQIISTTHPEELTLSLLANKVCLSASRLRALFKEVTGVSLHQYMLHNKIRLATNKIMSGHTVNDAAIDAGFTDSSHFHKMMMKLFGKSPSRFIKENLTVEELKCDDRLLYFETSYYNKHQWTLEKTIVE